jgi:hypothetical protein
MTEIINGVHLRSRIPFALWVFAALVTFASLMSSLTQAGSETHWRMAEVVQVYASLAH